MTLLSKSTSGTVQYKLFPTSQIGSIQESNKYIQKLIWLNNMETGFVANNHRTLSNKKIAVNHISEDIYLNQLS